MYLLTLFKLVLKVYNIARRSITPQKGEPAHTHFTIYYELFSFVMRTTKNLLQPNYFTVNIMS